MIRILVVDDQKLIREALKALLAPATDIEIVGTADNGNTAIEEIETLQPDVVLVDMEMPGINGISTTKIISEKYANTKVLVLSGSDRDEYVTQSLSAGAKGYLLKNTPAEELTEAIRSVYKGYAQLGPEVFEKMIATVSQSNSFGVPPSSNSNSIFDRNVIANILRH